MSENAKQVSKQPVDENKLRSEIMDRIRLGKSYEEIAKELGISVEDVIRYRQKRQEGEGVSREVEIPEISVDQVSILKEILGKVKAKSLTDAAKEAVIAIAETKGGMDPTELYNLLTSYGVNDKTAKAIMGMYYAKLYRAQIESQRISPTITPPFTSPPPTSTTPYYPWPPHPMYPTYQYPLTYPWTWPRSYPQTAMPVTPPRRYKIVVEGQEIETDERGYLAWLRYKQEQERLKREEKEWELKMKKLEKELEDSRKPEEKIPIPIDKDKTIEVPASLAPLYMSVFKGEDKETKREIERLREELHKKELEMVKKDLEELKRRPGLEQQLAYVERIARMLGYRQGARSTIDLLESGIDKLHQTAQSLINRLLGPGGEFKPEVTRTPVERKEKAEEVMRRLEKSEEILEAEDELIRAAAKIKPK